MTPRFTPTPISFCLAAVQFLASAVHAAEAPPSQARQIAQAAETLQRKLVAATSLCPPPA
jgi:hypothetical protein